MDHNFPWIVFLKLRQNMRKREEGGRKRDKEYEDTERIESGTPGKFHLHLFVPSSPRLVKMFATQRISWVRTLVKNFYVFEQKVNNIYNKLSPKLSSPPPPNQKEERDYI